MNKLLRIALVMVGVSALPAHAQHPKLDPRTPGAQSPTSIPVITDGVHSTPGALQRAAVLVGHTTCTPLTLSIFGRSFNEACDR